MVQFRLKLIFNVLLFVQISRAKEKLKFNSEGEFRILHLTDLHFGEGITDDYNVAGLYSLLRLKKPDLVILTGDLVSGYSYIGGNRFYQDCHQKFLKPIEELSIPYLFTLGNHDDEANMNRMEIMEYDSRNELSYTMNYPFYGTNYYVPIYNKDQSEEILRIWAFDTNDNGCGGHSLSWGCIDQEAINIFKAMSPGPSHGIAAMHIPPPEFMGMYVAQTTFGVAQEDISCPILDTGVIDAILKKKTIQFLIVGHDHRNDYGGKWPDQNSHLTLMYGRKSGYGGYKVCCDRLNGGRILDYKLIGQQLITDHYIVDHDNQTIYQKETQYYSLKDACSQSDSPGPMTVYVLIAIVVIVYFVVNTFILSMMYLKYNDVIRTSVAQENIQDVTQPNINVSTKMKIIQSNILQSD